MKKIDSNVVQKWSKALDGIKTDYMAEVTAQLLENQAKAVLTEASKLTEEQLTPGATTVGKLGTFQKFAFPIVRRVFPELIFNMIGSTQPMEGPVSQIFYLGNSRGGDINGDGTYGQQSVYSKYQMTYLGRAARGIGSTSAAGAWNDPATSTFGSGLDAANAFDAGGYELSNIISSTYGGPTTTYGGKIASFPDSGTIDGWFVSAGEQLRTSAIPEVSFHIQSQAVVAKTRKMRALWTIEASQDLKAYHNLDLERELTDLLSKEISLEIDRELIEEIRGIAYGFVGNQAAYGWDQRRLDNRGANQFGDTYGKSPNGGTSFEPCAFEYDFHNSNAGNRIAIPTNDTQRSNVFALDLTNPLYGFGSNISFAPQHVGHVYSNLLALINHASQDIYKTTMRGPGTVLITSPLVASLLESAAKLEGGLPEKDGPTNMGNRIEYRGKFAGKYTLIVDPLFPEDEIIVGYNGTNPMDAGFVYCPYIPLMPIQTITDPETFQPRKGIMTRYAKAAVAPASRFYRVIRLIGGGKNYLTPNIARVNGTAY
jgi:hypothetical protein